MNVVIRVKGSTGRKEYYKITDGVDEFVSNLQDAEMMSDFDAQRILDSYNYNQLLWPAIWKTAKIVPVKIVEL